MQCPSCAGPVPAGARFCPTCGTAVSPPSDERRVVTVLFADLVGFTGLSETRDPEQVKNLVDDCFAELVAEVRAHGGQVDKIVGDAIVALFGAPVAHEDDAERAVRAALRMQARLAAMGDHGVRAGAVDGDTPGLQLRVGVNTGEVLVGALRAGGAVTAMGDVVNTASRLQTVARPGQVVVGPATFAATQDVVRFEALGAIRARGREEPVEAWLATEALGPPGWRPPRRRTPLIGRDAELSLMRGAVDLAVQHGRAQLVLVLGEAGVGKTRLVEELAERAAVERDALVLQGRCVPYGEANVWWPLAEAVRSACGVSPAEPSSAVPGICRDVVAAALGESAEPTDVDQVVDGLRYLLGDEGPLSELEPTRARSQVAWALQTYLDALTRTRPVILVISDLHWADSPVLEVLGHVVTRLGGRPFLLLATSREPLPDGWTSPPGRHNALTVHLDPLDAEAAGALVEVLLGPDVPGELRMTVAERTGGNPFFIEELAAVLESAGPGPTPPDVPATLRGLVSARLDGLGAPERALVEVAAVLGRTGTLADLQDLAGPDVGIEGAVQRLVDVEVLELEQERWRFRSDLLREAAYSRLTKGERARRHAGAGALLARRESASEFPDGVASHFASAAELARELGGVDGVAADVSVDAVRWLEAAAVRSEGRESVVVTTTLAERALALLGDEPSAARSRLLLLRGRARAVARDLAGARADAEEALRESSGDPQIEAQAVTQLGDLLQKEGEADRAVEILGGAVERFRALGDRRGEAEALRRRGFAELFAQRPGGAADDFAESLRLSREVGDRRGEAWVLQHLAWIAFERGSTEEADVRLHESAEVFIEIGDLGGMGWAMGLLGWVRLQQGRFDEAEVIVRKVLPKAEAIGDQWGQGMMHVLAGLVALWRGRASVALAEGRRAEELFRRIGDDWGRTQGSAVMARSLISLGRLAEGRRQLEQMRSLSLGRSLDDLVISIQALSSAAMGDPGATLAALDEVERVGDGGMGARDIRTAEAVALLQLGRLDEALACVEQALEQSGSRPQADALAVQALAEAALGNHEAVEQLRDRVEATAGATYLDRGLAALALGLSAARTGQAAGALQILASARGDADATEDRLLQALVRLAEAEVLEVLGSALAEGARDEAEARLDAIGATRTGWRHAFRLVLGVPAGTA